MMETTVDPDLPLTTCDEREPSHVEAIDFRIERPDVKSF
jgi:hypothetical protein